MEWPNKKIVKFIEKFMGFEIRWVPSGQAILCGFDANLNFVYLHPN
jgi:hypothetical protein